jgi:hypothetical protein
MDIILRSASAAALAVPPQEAAAQKPAREGI